MIDRHRPILTIGYGNRTIDELLSLLERQDVQFVGDVRTSPYSRFAPDFSREALKTHLARVGIRYVFMGDTLGGNPDDESVRVGDKSGQRHYVVYEKVKELPSFQAGVNRLFNAWRDNVGLALLCSEAKPEACHRVRLIGVALDNTPVQIMHIDENDELRTQEEIMLRLDKGQASLPGIGNSAKSAKSSKAFG